MYYADIELHLMVKLILFQPTVDLSSEEKRKARMEKKRLKLRKKLKVG